MHMRCLSTAICGWLVRLNIVIVAHPEAVVLEPNGIVVTTLSSCPCFRFQAGRLVAKTVNFLKLSLFPLGKSVYSCCFLHN